MNAAQQITLSDSTFTVTLDPARGGAITALTILDGSSSSGNIVDNGDQTGRQIQAALYDGQWPPDVWPCPGTTVTQWGNDPVQAGNACQDFSGGSVLAQSATSITTTTTPLQWNAALGASKVTLQQMLTITAPGTLRIDYTVTSDEDHEIGASNWQEMPGAYFDKAFASAWYVDATGWMTKFVQTHPGTNDLRPLTTGEPWIMLTRPDGYAVALVIPQHLTPWAIQLGGGDQHSASFLDALHWLQLQPGETQTVTTYVVVGRTLDQARGRIDLLLSK